MTFIKIEEASPLIWGGHWESSFDVRRYSYSRKMRRLYLFLVQLKQHKQVGEPCFGLPRCGRTKRTLQPDIAKLTNLNRLDRQLVLLLIKRIEVKEGENSTRKTKVLQNF